MKVKPSPVHVYESPDGEVYTSDQLFERFLQEELAIDREGYEAQATTNPTLKKYVNIAYANWVRKKGFKRAGGQPTTSKRYVLPIPL